MRKLTRCCLSVVLCVGIPAQTVHFVGTGGFSQIRAALAVAVAGDVIHVAPGSYQHFRADVGVTIRALTPGTVRVEYDASLAPTPCGWPCIYDETTTQLVAPAGQTVHLVGLEFGPPSTGLVRLGRVEVDGRATFDQCRLTADSGSPLFVHGGAVHLQETDVLALGTTAASSAMIVHHADVTIVGGEFQAGTSLSTIFDPAQPGIQLVSSRLHASAMSARGGIVPAWVNGAPAIEADGESALWVSDSSLVSGPFSCALELGGAVARIDRCQITNHFASCAPPPAGGFLLGVDRPAPLTPGNLFTLDFQAEPNGFVAVVAAPSLDSTQFPGLLEQPLWLGGAGAFGAALAVADGTGLATVDWQIPSGPGVADLALWFVGVSGSTLPLQVSPAVGGIAR